MAGEGKRDAVILNSKTTQTISASSPPKVTGKSSLPLSSRHGIFVRHLLPTDDGCDVVHDSERAVQAFETVPVRGHPGADLIEAKEPTLEALLEALAELESQTDFSPRTTRNTRIQIFVWFA